MSSAPTLESNKDLIRKAIDNVVNAHEPNNAEQYFDRNLKVHTLPPGFSHDLKGIKQWYGTLFRAMPDVRMTADEMIGQGDKLALRWTMKGTHEGELLGVPATNERLEIQACVIAQVKDGKIVDIDGVVEQMDVLRQMGAIDMPAMARKQSANPTRGNTDLGRSEIVAMYHRFADEVMNAGNAEAVERFYHADVKDNTLPPDAPQGLKGLEEWHHNIARAFPDGRLTFQDILVDGAAVAARWTFTGTHKQDFLNIPATNKRVEVKGCQIDHLKGDKIIETNGAVDNLGMLVQMGVMEPPKALRE